MKILFLCASLEPEKDGVGDYVKLLGIEMMKQGHEVVAIGMYDRYIDKTTDSFFEHQGFKLRVTRVPSLMVYEKRREVLLDKFNSAKPDWVSFHFVPYAFNMKGLPFKLPAQLKALGFDCNWHIMLHEIWLGISVVSPIKHKLIGALQRRIIRNIIHKIKPAVLTTSNFLYHSVLKAKKIDTTILPLFSNIPVHEPDTEFSDEVFSGLGISANERNKWKKIGIFGNIYPSSLLEDTLNQELNSKANENSEFAFICIGRLSDWAVREFERLTYVFEGKIKFIQLGILSEKRVSTVLQLLDLGISCTPAEHIGKSGVFAAMKLHGLKVITPEKDSIPEFSGETRKLYSEFVVRPGTEWSVEKVATQFARQLKTFSKS